jgi:uncharacterized membrane protein
MSYLVALAYADEHRAAEVLAALRRFSSGAFAQVGDAVYVVRRTDWTVLLSREVDLSVTDDCCMQFWRSFIASLILAPGLASPRSSVGLYGVEPGFERRLTMALPPGSSAVMLTVPPHALEHLTSELYAFGGTMCATPIGRWCDHQPGLVAAVPHTTRRPSGKKPGKPKKSMNTLMARAVSDSTVRST